MISLALKMLMGDRTKYYGLIAGFFFTALMITQMTSLFAGIMARTFTLLTETPGVEIWVMDPAVETVNEVAPMRKTALDRVRSVPGVLDAQPMYVGNIRARMPSGRFVNCEIVGIDEATLTGAPYSHGFDWSVLRQSDSIVVDNRSAAIFLYDSFDRTLFTKESLPVRPIKTGDQITLNDRYARVVGMADVGSRMFAKAVIYTTYDRAVGWSPPQKNGLTYILVRSDHSIDSETLCERINQTVGLRALTKSQFATETVWYTIAHTDIIKQVSFMIFLASTVGIVVTGLLLSMFISDNLKYFATLKAMGLGNGKIAMMIYTQTVWCGAIGCGMGIGGACLIGVAMKRIYMPFLLLWPAAVSIPVLVLLMCLITCTLSIRRVLRLEPAIVFK